MIASVFPCRCIIATAWSWACSVALRTGRPWSFPARLLAQRACLSAVQSERCTALFGVPTMYIAILADPDFASYDLSTLRTGNMGAASVPPSVMQQVIERMNMTGVTNSYGMTETSPISFQTQVNDPLDIRVTTVGRIHPHLQAKIIDETGHVVPIGQRGELCIRGYSVMRGYWEAPEETASVIDEAGWLHTGDLAVFDENFVCRIVGRVKEMINRGGEKISPTDIEIFLIRHPKVMDVTVFGVPDEKFGEQVRPGSSCTRGSGDEEEIKEFCRNASLITRIPTHIVFVHRVPMTASGKVQKYVVREQMGPRARPERVKTARRTDREPDKRLRCRTATGALGYGLTLAGRVRDFRLSSVRGTDGDRRCRQGQ